MLRHSVLWTLRDTTTPALQVEMLEGLAYLGTECASVRHGDYGEDIFGAGRAAGLGQSPMWRREGLPPPGDFAAALHLDFDDWSAFELYGRDPVHEAASRFNESVSWDELTARVDWHYDGERRTCRGHVRHVAMFVWADSAGETERQAAFTAVTELEAVDGVEAVSTGTNVGVHPSDYDWILDVQLPDRAAAEHLLDGTQYARAMEAVAAVTRYEWTARVTHLMRGR